MLLLLLKTEEMNSNANIRRSESYRENQTP